MTRREFLSGGVALGSMMRFAQNRSPAIIMRDSARPAMPCGVASGDVTAERAIVWSRTDRPARMIVEYSTSPSFRDMLRIVGPAALEDTDFTARVDLTELPPNQRITYRVRFQDLSDLRTFSEPVEGAFVTPTDRVDRDVIVAFSGDSVGQGWGIDPARGGMRLTTTMRRRQPDVFVHLGDTIYADQPLQPQVMLDDGSVWRNMVTRGEVARSPRRSPTSAAATRTTCWTNTAALQRRGRPGRALGRPRSARQLVSDAAAGRRRAVQREERRAARRARETGVSRLQPASHQPDRVGADLPIVRVTARSLEIFALDMRSYRGPNSTNRQTELMSESAILGAAQLAWLEARAGARRPPPGRSSRATCRSASSFRTRRGRFEAVANGDDGPPLGRELEIAALLKFIRDQRIRNVVWITADVHYCAAHHYDPSRARIHGVRRRSGSSSPARSTPARSVRTTRRDVWTGSEVHRHSDGR